MHATGVAVVTTFVVQCVVISNCVTPGAEYLRCRSALLVCTQQPALALEVASQSTATHDGLTEQAVLQASSDVSVESLVAPAELTLLRSIHVGVQAPLLLVVVLEGATVVVVDVDCVVVGASHCVVVVEVLVDGVKLEELEVVGVEVDRVLVVVVVVGIVVVVVVVVGMVVGMVVVVAEVVEKRDGETAGNCDTAMVLHRVTMRNCTMLLAV